MINIGANLLFWLCWTWTDFWIAIQLDAAIQNRIWIGLDFEKNSSGSNMDIQTELITAVKCLITVFSDKTGLDQIFGQYYRFRIRLDYTMKILDWIRIAKSSIRLTLASPSRGCHGSWVPESTPAGFCVFFRYAVKKFWKTGSGVTFHFQQ